MSQEIKYPYILFKLDGLLYCINSKYILTIVQMPEYSAVPAAPANVTGMFRYRDQVIQMLNLRITFGMKSLADECREFEEMIDARKQDHMNWVKELERFIEEGGSFQLPKDPHQCALGKWYNRFETDNQAVAFQLRKIEEPHRKLHEAAEEAERCKRDCKNCKRNECLLTILKRVKEECMPTILELLDETKETFRSSIYKEMVLVLDGMNWGIVVDEIVAVEDLKILDARKQTPMVEQCGYIANVMESPSKKGLIFELDIDAFTREFQKLEKTF